MDTKEKFGLILFILGTQFLNMGLVNNQNNMMILFSSIVILIGTIIFLRDYNEEENE